MNQYYKVVAKVENEVVDNKGKAKTQIIREEYLVSDVTPTGAEAKINNHLKGLDFEVISIVLTKIIEVLKKNA